MDYDRARLEEALSIDVEEWKKEILARTNSFFVFIAIFPRSYTTRGIADF